MFNFEKELEAAAEELTMDEFQAELNDELWAEHLLTEQEAIEYVY